MTPTWQGVGGRGGEERETFSSGWNSITIGITFFFLEMSYVRILKFTGNSTMVNNDYRPVQGLNGRVVKNSFQETTKTTAVSKNWHKRWSVLTDAVDRLLLA